MMGLEMVDIFNVFAQRRKSPFEFYNVFAQQNSVIHESRFLCSAKNLFCSAKNQKWIICY